MKYLTLTPFILALCACTGAQHEATSAINASSSVLAASSSVASLSSSSSISSASSSEAPQPITFIEESEQAFCTFNGAIEIDHTGFTGDGYANASNALNAALTWSIQLDEPGNYSLGIRFANGGATDRTATFTASGKSQSLAFPAGSGWGDWQTQTLNVSLNAGNHLLTLTPQTSAGLANIDSLSIKGPSIAQPGMCPAQAPIAVWLAGDSTVANGQTPCPVGWGKTLPEYFNDKVTVHNRAVGGRSVRTWLYDVSDRMASDGECAISYANGSPVLQQRWTSMLNEMKAGDWLFIQFGINDGSRTCPRHVGQTAFRDAYTYMANEAIARGANPVLVTPAPMIRCSGSTAVANRGFIDAVKSVGEQLNLPVIDLHQLGIDRYNQLGFCPVEGGDVSASTGGEVGAYFCNDHTHFDTPGARDIAAIITNALAAQGLSLADYLLPNN